MKKIVFLAMTILLLGAGCNKLNKNLQTTSPEQNREATSWKSYVWAAYNPVLKKETTVSFTYPSDYQIFEDKKSNYTRLIIKGPEGRVEIDNVGYYDGLPAPDMNPSAERKKELDEQLPKNDIVMGWRGDFYVYSFFSEGNQSVREELKRIIDSIVIKDLSQQK